MARRLVLLGPRGAALEFASVPDAEALVNSGCARVSLSLRDGVLSDATVLRVSEEWVGAIRRGEGLSEADAFDHAWDRVKLLVGKARPLTI